MTIYVNDTGEPVEVEYTDDQGSAAVLTVGVGARIVIADADSAVAAAADATDLTNTPTED